MVFLGTCIFRHYCHPTLELNRDVYIVQSDLLWTRSAAIFGPFLPFLLDKWKNYRAIRKLGPSTHLFMMNGSYDTVVAPAESLSKNQKAVDARPRTNPQIANFTAYYEGDHSKDI